MSAGSVQRVPFRFQVSDWTLFKIHRRLQVRAFGIKDRQVGLDALPPAGDPADGLMLRSIPLVGPDDAADIASVEVQGRRLLRYVIQRFPRYVIDMSQDFDSYRGKFSGKTRSTISRKIKKFTEFSGGELQWERFSRPEDLERFWRLARTVSAKSYQERLLDVGLPEDPAFFSEARRLAAADLVRAFLLFDRGRPVSYLYCPVEDGVLIYAYLGYDPEYIRHSVGTVLQWLALESLFAERRFQYFDFTEGESEHKRLFATGSLSCANIALLNRSVSNRLLVHGHRAFLRAAERVGDWLERHHLKARIKRWMRFGRAG